MNVLIVIAHPEPTSFNHAMARTAGETLGAAGHAVEVSDLYALRFDPVSDRRNFLMVADDARLDLHGEERAAMAAGSFVPELAREMDKVARSDLVIFQFPLWWMGMPAIMKGWIDRVFALDFAYGGGRWFDQGRFAAKRAMLAFSVGGPAEAYGPDGIYGPMAQIVGPIHHGVLKFVGFTVLEPFVAYGPGRLDADGRRRLLAEYRAAMAAIAQRPALEPVASAEFDRFVRRRAQ
jgi:NAD(P)H dehydrogenase (quinone)